MELLSVDNLVFVLPLALAVVLVVFMALGLPFGDDVGHHVHLGGGLADGLTHVGHVGGVADGVHVPDLHGHLHSPMAHGPAGLHAILGFFGIGKVPFNLVLISFCMIWGVSGLGLRLLNVDWSLASRVVIVLVTAVAGTRLTAGTIGHFLPSVETYGVAAADLVSEYAEVIHDVTPDGGTVRLVDSEGNLRDVACRSTLPTSPSSAPLHFKRGERIILSAYDEATDIYLAAATDSVTPASGPMAQRPISGA